MSISLSIPISRADKERSSYFYVPFDVPRGTTRIDVQMRYSKAEDCVVDLGVFDTGFAPFPSKTGFRGWSGGARDSVFVATDDATPGYIPGVLPSGTWQIALGLYRLPPSPVTVELMISLDASPRATIALPPRSTAQRSGSGWYRGDLQSHCHHSDAAGAPELLHETARRLGLDFLAVTDHNTISQRRYFDLHSSPELVFLRATEITTEFGHANVYGSADWVDFRMERPEDSSRMAARARELGGLVSINHDKPTIPWQWPIPQIDCYEVWQSAWPALNAISLSRYQALLASGRRITCIGGSDYHQPGRVEADHPLGLGRPTTVLYMDNLSEDDILGALQAGRGYVTESATGPHLEITVEGHPMGSEVTAPSHLRCHVNGARGDMLVIRDAHSEVARVAISSDDCDLLLHVAGARQFLMAEIVAEGSRARLLAECLPALPDVIMHPQGAEIPNGPLRRALSNPIYISPC